MGGGGGGGGLMMIAYEECENFLPVLLGMSKNNALLKNSHRFGSVKLEV